VIEWPDKGRGGAPRALASLPFVVIALLSPPAFSDPVELSLPIADAQGKGLAAGWRRVVFPSIPQTTDYTVVVERGRPILHARSERGASALLHRLDLDPREWPRLRWRWRIRRLPEGADIHRRSGDDYAGRIYVTFAEPLSELGWFERLQYESARLVYGDYPPLRAINYVWARLAPVGTIVPNPTAPRAMMVVVGTGGTRLGRWVEVERDLRADYRRLFRREPPRIDGIAIMTDSDDTASVAEADYADIRFLGAE